MTRIRKLSRPSGGTVERWRGKVGVESDPAYSPCSGMVLDPSHTMGLIVDPEEFLASEGFRAFRGDVEAESYRLVRLKTLRSAGHRIRICGNTYNPRLIAKALQVLGRKNLHFYVAGRDLPVMIVNGEGEAAVVAPVIGLDGETLELKKLEAENLEEASRKKEGGEWR